MQYLKVIDIEMIYLKSDLSLYHIRVQSKILFQIQRLSVHPSVCPKTNIKVKLVKEKTTLHIFKGDKKYIQSRPLGPLMKLVFMWRYKHWKQCFSKRLILKYLRLKISSGYYCLWLLYAYCELTNLASINCTCLHLRVTSESFFLT